MHLKQVTIHDNLCKKTLTNGKLVYKKVYKYKKKESIFM